MLDKIRWKTLFEISYTDTTESDIEKLLEQKMTKLNQLLLTLPPRCREIFIKNKLEKRKYRVIAIDMNISIKIVASQMSKALQFLKANAHNFML